MRKLLMIAAGVLVLLVVVVFALSMFVDADRFRPQAEQQASDALGRQVTLGKLKLAVFSGGVSSEGLSIADDPKFSKDPFLTAESLKIGVDLRALIFDKKLNIRSFLIHAPKVSLVRNAEGKWNYESLASKSTDKKGVASASGAPPDFAVGKFALDDGQVAIHHVASGKTVEYSNLRIEAKDVSLATNFPYEVSAKAPGGGTVEAKGTLGPIAEHSERTPMTAQITVKRFDVAATGFTDSGSPLKGLVDMDADVKSDGTRTHVDARIVGNKMCLTSGCSPASAPIGLNVKATYLLTDELANLNSGQIKLGSSTASLTGTIELKGAKPKINARVDAPNLAVNDIEKILPALAIVLPSGAKLQGGNASLKATATGPADALVVTGHVELHDSKITGYDLGSKLSAMAKLAGISASKETVIQEFSSDVQQTPKGTKADNMLLVLPGLGKLTGAGTMGEQNDLNFAMKAQIDASHSPVGMIGSALGRKNTNIGIPFHITGTTKNPMFTPDFADALGLKAAGGAAGKGTEGLANAVQGLFGKKKKQ